MQRPRESRQVTQAVAVGRVGNHRAEGFLERVPTCRDGDPVSLGRSEHQTASFLGPGAVSPDEDTVPDCPGMGPSIAQPISFPNGSANRRRSSG